MGTCARLRLGLIACGMAAALAVPSASSAVPDRPGRAEVVKVVDFELKPERLNLERGKAIDFRWSPRNSNPHQIVLRRAPAGVDRSEFVSETGEQKVEFGPRLPNAGRYRFICNIHPISMELNVNVAGGER